ncbi:MAG: bifunctional 4-hydroxy-2-oxoglutarate aldolase/2-dehydro-3-deoxy-phosphogluconate aldolase [Chloroflexota bacterium]
MASRETTLQRIIDCGIVAVIRMSDPSRLIKVAEAIGEGGVDVIEFTMTTPNALDVIREVARQRAGDVLLGAGTVLDPETARAAILAGAEYIVAPTLNPRVIEVCRRYSKVVIPGALTPTEILTAWECGADIVKVFPATAVGPRYFKDVLAPLPQVKLLPTGGVDLSNVGDFIKAGAVAVAVGSNLVDTKAVSEGRFDVLTEKARQYAEAVRSARSK